MATRIRSFSKINLGLAVGPARPDGFHGLTTAYQTLGLHDLLWVEAQPAERTEVTLEANHPGVPCTAAGNAERNTAFRMVSGALDRLGMTARVHLRLHKRLPVQGGLGAGSANAAAALLGLERELGLALPGPERLQLAAEVGSDVPLFLIGGTVLGVGRGETVFPLPDSPSLPVVVAVPNVGVSTAQAFRDLDARPATEMPSEPSIGLTSPAQADKLNQLSRVLASTWTPSGLNGAGRVTTGIANFSASTLKGSEELPPGGGERQSTHQMSGDLAETGGQSPLLTLVRTGVENDFESVAFRQHPSLRHLKLALLGEKTGSPDERSGALYAALSGSGSAIFGVYPTREAAYEAQRRVQSCGNRALLTETLPRRRYWQRMFA